MDDLSLLLDLSFLDWLDMQLHAEKKIRVKTATALVDTFTSRKITEEEIATVCNTIKNDQLLFYPKKVPSGYELGFVVAGVDRNKQYELLQFGEHQLPKGYSFKTLSRYFLTKENKLLANNVGVAIYATRDQYT
jgi:hypothetical protein